MVLNLRVLHEEVSVLLNKRLPRYSFRVLVSAAGAPVRLRPFRDVTVFGPYLRGYLVYPGRIEDREPS